MNGSLFRRLRGPLVGACATALVLTAATALAGSGIGGVVNLGQTNTVDAETTLSGNAGGNPQLRVNNTSGAANAFGILGRITSGSPSAQSAGVRGINSGMTGNGYGVWGSHQASGTGVYGSSNEGTGVKGFSSSTGVKLGTGVYGSSASTGIGVHGFVPGEYYCTPSPPLPECERRGKAVFGDSTDGYAIYGRSPNGYAGYFEGSALFTRGVTIGPVSAGHALYASNSGANSGVIGTSSSGTGVFGQSASGRGVWGNNNAPTRSSSGNPGVYGSGDAEDGVWAISSRATGIYAQAPNYAAYLNGRVFIDRSLSLGWRTFADSDTTPDVRDGSLFRVSNSSSTLITNFDNGRSGQQLTLRFTNSNTDVADNSTLRLAGSFSPTADDTLQLVSDGANWYEIGRSSN